MDHIKASLGKSSNIQRATRPGVIQITHNDDNGSSVASVAASGAGVQDCGPPLPIHVMVAPGPQRASSPQPPASVTDDGDVDVHSSGLLRQQEEDIGNILPGSSPTEELPPATNDWSEEQADNSQDQQQQQVLHQEREDCLLPEEEELLFDAEVELIGVGGDDHNNDDEDDHPAATTEELPVTSVQLTQGSFPIAQPVNDSFEDVDEEDMDPHLIIEEGVDDILLNESIHSNYSNEILLRQEVALATTDGEGEQGGVVQIQGSSSSTEEKGKKFMALTARRSSRIVCVVIGALAVVGCVVGAVIALSRKNEGSDVTSDKEPTDLNIDDNVNVVEVLLQSFLEKIGTNEHRIPGSPQYRAIHWLYESAREGSERFNLSEWAIRKLLVQRYVMAVLYFTTGGGGTADKSMGWDEECGFLSAKSECQWKCTKNGIDIGITCDESSRIEKILLPSNNLSGPIPNEFKALASLVEVDISKNNIGGELPESIGDLRNLKSFNAANNKLAGNLPSSLGNLSFLRVLNLKDNNLTGKIPPEVSRLGSLSWLWLSGNEFTGGMNNFCDSEHRPFLRDRKLRSHISTFYADCSGMTSPSAGASVQCDCCTHCCNAGTCEPNSS